VSFGEISNLKFEIQDPEIADETAEYAEHAEEELIAKNALSFCQRVPSKPHSSPIFRVFRVFCG